MSPKLQLRRIGVHIPVDLANWLIAKADAEAKSLSLLITEILEKTREEEERQNGGS